MKKIILILSCGGLLFAGYLSAVKFFNDSCALGETCPLFLGLPACYFGFAMYLALTILSALFVLRTSQSHSPLVDTLSSLGASETSVVSTEASVGLEHVKTAEVFAGNGLRKGILFVSLLGILFAGYFTIGELPVLFEKGFGSFALGLPTCAWGLLFYVAIFVCTFKVKK